MYFTSEMREGGRGEKGGGGGRERRLRGRERGGGENLMCWVVLQYVLCLNVSVL